jgi:DNA-binding CsgD family transcriptional regulator
MYKCITCGTELHPERAKKYNYCMSPACQEKNAKGLTMVAVGVNKSAEQYMLLDDQTKEELASGKYHDQRRGSFGTSPASAAPAPAAPTAPAAAVPAPARPAPAPAGSPATPGRPAPITPAQPATHEPKRPAAQARQTQARRPQPQPQLWTPSQQRLALLYNEQGLRPDEIAQKLGLSRYLVTQIILNSRTRGKL